MLCGALVCIHPSMCYDVTFLAEKTKNSCLNKQPCREYQWAPLGIQSNSPAARPKISYSNRKFQQIWWPRILCSAPNPLIDRSRCLFSETVDGDIIFPHLPHKNDVSIDFVERLNCSNWNLLKKRRTKKKDGIEEYILMNIYSIVCLKLTFRLPVLASVSLSDSDSPSPSLFCFFSFVSNS